MSRGDAPLKNPAAADVSSVSDRWISSPVVREANSLGAKDKAARYFIVFLIAVTSLYFLTASL